MLCTPSLIPYGNLAGQDFSCFLWPWHWHTYQIVLVLEGFHYIYLDLSTLIGKLKPTQVSLDSEVNKYSRVDTFIIMPTPP